MRNQVTATDLLICKQILSTRFGVITVANINYEVSGKIDRFRNDFHNYFECIISEPLILSERA